MKTIEIINVSLIKKEDKPALSIIGVDSDDCIHDIGSMIIRSRRDVNAFLNSLNTGINITWEWFKELDTLLKRINDSLMKRYYNN